MRILAFLTNFKSVVNILSDWANYDYLYMDPKLSKDPTLYKNDRRCKFE